MDTTSASLLARLRLPDAHESWRRFVRLYTPLLYSWARGAGLQDSDAADLVQDVLTTVVQKLPEFSYQPAMSFRGWLRTILLNRWRDNCRRRRPAPLEGREALLDGLTAADHAPQLEEEEYRHYLVGRALRLMRSDFQPETWHACWEYVVAGRPPADVARELGVTVNAIYHAKARVLARLRQELDGLLD